jgi:hypothetical protein
VHPHRREGETAVLEGLLQQPAEVQRRLAELAVSELPSVQVVLDRAGVHGGLGDARLETRGVSELAHHGAAGVLVPVLRRPATDQHLDLVAARGLIGDEHIPSGPARDPRGGGVAVVVPEAIVAVELERHVGRGRVAAFARESEVEERVRPPLVHCRPRIEDVVLRRVRSPVLRAEDPGPRFELLTACEHRVWVVRIRAVLHAPQALPVDPGVAVGKRFVVLVAVGALEQAACQRRVGP